MAADPSHAPYVERRSSVVRGTLWRSRTAGEPRTILPDGCMDLIWDGHRLFVAGPDSAPYPWQPSGASARRPRTLVGVRFDSGTARDVLGVPAVDLRDDRVDLDLVWPAHVVRRWADQLAESAAPARVLEELAAERAGDTPRWVAAAVRLADEGRRVGDIASTVGLSERQLHRRSLDRFGYGVKTLQRIRRLRAATDDVRAGTALSDAASLHGYADYAHLYREMRQLYGQSPAVLTGQPAGA